MTHLCLDVDGVDDTLDLDLGLVDGGGKGVERDGGDDGEDGIHCGIWEEVGYWRRGESM